MIAYLCLGSNIGNAIGFVEKGVVLISKAIPGCAIVRTEPIVSSAWGYDSDNLYVNLTIRIDTPSETTEGNALELLDILQKIEKEISDTPHRNADGTYHDREIDIDIIAIEGLRMSHVRLILPHPRAALRDFVRIPMRQLGAAELLA